jgi:hypothetical protein
MSRLRNQSVNATEGINRCSENQTEHVNVLCRQNVEIFNIEPGGMFKIPLSVKGLPTPSEHQILCP